MKTTQRAYDKLVASIEKWEGKKAELSPSNIQIGTDGCPLCWVFNYGRGCLTECPIKATTGHSFCNGTPYIKASMALIIWKLQGNRFHYRWIEACDEMINFMKNIRDNAEISN